jgi:hypothetical protein
LEKLLMAGVIRFSEYLERLPDGYINKKEELLEKVREREEAQKNGFQPDGQKID